MKSSLKINNVFYDDEFLLRVVRPKEEYWKENGKISSAALKDKKGLSVTRGYKDEFNDRIKIMKEIQKLEGSTVAISVKKCKEVKTFLIHKPTNTNYFHSEIHRNAETILLSDYQAKILAKNSINID